MVVGGEDDHEENTHSLKNSGIEVFNNSIRRTNVADVYTTRVKKKYKFNYTKRQIGDN